MLGGGVAYYTRTWKVEAEWSAVQGQPGFVTWDSVSKKQMSKKREKSIYNNNSNSKQITVPLALQCSRKIAIWPGKEKSIYLKVVKYLSVKRKSWSFHLFIWPALTVTQNWDHTNTDFCPQGLTVYRQKQTSKQRCPAAIEQELARGALNCT